MAKIKNMSYDYDELGVAKKYFEYDDEIRNFTKYMIFTKNTNQGILRFVIKYLLHELNVTPYECEDIIRRYTVLITYDYLRMNYPDNMQYITELDEILDNPLSVKVIRNVRLSKDTLIEKIYKKSDEKEYNKNIDLLCEEYKLDASKSKAVKNFLKKDNYFFSNNGSIESLEKNTRSFDQMISETIIDAVFDKFNIAVDDSQIEQFCPNFHNSLSGGVFNKNIPLLFGFLVNDIIKNTNQKLNQKVSLVSSDKFKIILVNKDANISNKDCYSYMNFINEDNSIDKTKIECFEFVFNNVKYLFTKDGIKEI